MYSNPTTSDRGNENYRTNAGASPKYETTPKYKPAVKQGYHNKQNKFAHVGILRTANNGKHDNQKRCDNHDNQNRDRSVRLGITRMANDARTDNQRRYENCDNHNQNRHAHVGMMQGADSGRYENQKKYDYENYNRFDNHNHNRYDRPNRYGNQSRRDNYNRYDKQIGRREDVQDRFMDKIGKMKKSEFKVQRQGSIQGNPIAAHMWRVVCDSMLGGLSSKLRMCGVDCVHVLFDQGGDDSAKLAMRENRVLLTRNKNYERVRFNLYTFVIVELLLNAHFITCCSSSSIYHYLKKTAIE